MLRIKQLPTFDSVAAGKKAVVDLPLGLRYHAIWLELGNNAVAANAITDLVEDIVVKINGKPQRTHSGFQLNVINGINGSSYLLQASGTNGQADRRLYLPIWFAEPWRKNQQEVSSLALRANGIESFQVEVQVKAGLAAPIVQGWYEFDYDNRDIGLISKMIRQDYSAVGTSRDTWPHPTATLSELLETVIKRPNSYTSIGTYHVSVDEKYWCGEFKPATSAAPPSAPRMPETPPPQ